MIREGCFRVLGKERNTLRRIISSVTDLSTEKE